MMRVRLAAAVLLLGGAGFAGFGGLEGLYLVSLLAGVVAGTWWALAILPPVSVAPALFVDTGLGFHADLFTDYVLAAPIVLGGVALAALLGVLVSMASVRGWRSLRAPGASQTR